MKSRTTLIILAAIIMAFTSCDKIIMPSGKITQENYSITDYSEIDISDAFDVSLTFSPTSEGIIIEADDNVHEYIDIKKIGNRLYIGVERNFNLNGRGTLKAYISTNQPINELYASGASTLKIEDQLEGASVKMEVSGASRILGSVDIDQLSAKASGASNINLSGSTNNFITRASGASQIGGYELLNKDIDADFSGASTGFFNFEGTMNVVASGASTIYYKGDGTVDSQEITGASNIINAN
ncbi:MAG: head GIN domain-containing protein [Chitinophagales bacterium]